MKTLFLILFPFLLFAQTHIVIDSAQAELVKGKYGKYSEIQPILTFDGKFIVPTACLSDADLIQAKEKLLQVNQVVTTIADLPAIGQTVYEDTLYKSEDGVVKCRQTHQRTIYPPSQTPALFSFFRENSDTLSWIPNEWVYKDYKRFYESIQYTCLQPHQTQSDWTPIATLGVLWKPVDTGGEGCREWVQPSGDPQTWFNTGDCAIFNGKCYVSNRDANVWSPAVLPSGWDEIPCP